MPAEIDTGGPRVLHCDYRADCPIPIVGSASSASECRSHHQTTATFLRRASDIPRETPGTDCRTSCSSESLAGSYRRRVSGGPSVRASLRPPRRRAFSESRSNEFEDPREEQDAGRCFGAESSNSDKFREQGESRLGEGVARTISETEARIAGSESWLREDACSRRSCPEAHLPVGWSLLSSHRSRAPSVDRSPGEASLSLEASCIEQQSLRRTHSCSWRPTRLDYRHDQACTSKKLRRVCPKSRSYFQLALLLFLVAFGQSGLLKSGVLHHSAKASTTGLSVLAIGTVIGAVSGAPIDLIGDAGVRAERSANLSHITGASRKIQMYIKNRHLQILPDGTVNGSNDDTSDYTIFQRTSVSRGQLRIQGVATCLYLCMDSCGLLYGSREYTEDCVFNETLEQHNYNTYSSVRWSTVKKTLYLGLNRRGQPRRVQVKGHNLGRLSAYARVLTQVAPPDRVEALQRRMLGAQHSVRHRHNARGGQHHHRGDVIQQSLCPTLPAQEKDGRDRFRCRKRKKRKKRKRRCRPGEKPGPQCQLPEERADSGELLTTTLPAVDEEGAVVNDSSGEWKRSCEGAAASEETCRHELTSEASATLRPEEEASSPAESASGGNASRNGKSKAPASGAKKVGLAGSMSQSKKPNLTDGKKRKRKGTTPARRNQPPVQGRKRLGLGTTSSRSAPDMATTAQPFTMSSLPSLPPGASTGPPAGRGASPRRRKLPTSPRNGFDRSNSPPHQRRVGKTLFKPKNQRRLDSPAEGELRTASAVTVPYQYSREPTSTALVPETSVFDRSESSTAGILDDPLPTEALAEPSDTSSPDEEATSTTSGEYHTSTPESKTQRASDGATSAPEIFRLLEDDRSVEDASEDAEENEEDARFFSTESPIHPSTTRFPLERLAM